MDAYVEVKVVADPEFPPNEIISVFWAKLHQTLARLKEKEIGISFPDENEKVLGRRLRLHGSAEKLSHLMSTKWLGGTKDHIEVSEILERPAGCKFRVVQRVQVQSSVGRLRRRAMKRHGLDERAAEERIPDSAAKHLDLPFVKMSSASTGNPFRLFVRHGPISEEEKSGSFSTYGLSGEATVPWF